MPSPLLAKSAVLTGVVALVVGLSILAFKPNFTELRRGKPDEGYVTSENCRSCHENHYDSWRRTFHSRMTQEAKFETVQGDFDRDNRYEYQGVKATMERRDNGFWMSFSYPDGKTEVHKIVRTVGSRRIEQYVTQQNGQYYRLPIAYDLVNKRWMSLNGSFFYPDGGDFKQHFAQWDTNCVFCHNVKPQPNFSFETRLAKTEVAELGIACGACHGASAQHIESASSPFTRVGWRLIGENDKKIVDPLKLDTDRAMMICGHCHGQRIPEPESRIREILQRGDPFDAGEDLAAYYKPVHRETTIGNVSFASRFWDDGSPRLTAYEYQGILESECFKKGEPGNRINCLSCHTMHEGDVRGQITEAKRSNQACTQCHGELADTAALKQHTRHDVSSSGSSCYSCHMPDVVYGIQSFHKTHNISIPRPDLTIEKNVPNACNQCHVDRSANWAVLKSKELWPKHYSGLTASADIQFDAPETVRGLFGGDALTRAMMADALTRHSNPDWFAAFLVESFADENYPIVRFFDAIGLAQMNSGRPKPDYLADADSRAAQISSWANLLEMSKRNEAREFAVRLRKLRRDVDLEVGE